MKKLTIFSLVIFLIIGCTNKELSSGEKVIEASQVVEGGLYYSVAEGGKYTVSKILVIGNHAFHVRIYANKFTKPPLLVKTSELTLGGIGKPGGFGIGHAPMAKAGFLKEPTYYIRKETVSANELEGYRLYRKAMENQ